MVLQVVQPAGSFETALSYVHLARLGSKYYIDHAFNSTLPPPLVGNASSMPACLHRLNSSREVPWLIVWMLMYLDHPWNTACHDSTSNTRSLTVFDSELGIIPESRPVLLEMRG